jgi:hypothetical protein
VLPCESPLIGIICLLEPKLTYISPFTNQSQFEFCLGEPSPNFGGRGGSLGGRVWYSVKARHNMYNVSVGTVTLYICDCEHVKFGGRGPGLI